jgi:hypothetical protein
VSLRLKISQLVAAEGAPIGASHRPSATEIPKGGDMNILELQKFENAESEALDLGSTISNGC